MKFKISIIVPVYCVEKYISQTIDSILNQTYKNIEIILVNDNSPDSSYQICENYAREYSNIRVINKEHNEGLGLACNTGIDNVTGDYVAFCDSDDWVDPEMYETLLNTAIKNKADAVYSGLKRVNDSGDILGYMHHPHHLLLYKSKDDIQSLFLDMIGAESQFRESRHIQVSAKVVLYNMDIIRKNKLRFVSERDISSEDLCFNLSYLTCCNRVVVLPDIFYNYRVNTNSITNQIREDLFEKIKRLYSFTYNLCKLNNIENANIRIDRMFIDSSRNQISNICKSSIDLSKKIQLINEICTDSIWVDIWPFFPIYKMWWKHRLFSYALKYKCIPIIYIFGRIG